MSQMLQTNKQQTNCKRKKAKLISKLLGEVGKISHKYYTKAGKELSEEAEHGLYAENWN